jgi:hypothetical protein
VTTSNKQTAAHQTQTDDKRALLGITRTYGCQKNAGSYGHHSGPSSDSDAISRSGWSLPFVSLHLFFLRNAELTNVVPVSV